MRRVALRVMAGRIGVTEAAQQLGVSKPHISQVTAGIKRQMALHGHIPPVRDVAYTHTTDWRWEREVNKRFREVRQAEMVASHGIGEADADDFVRFVRQRSARSLAAEGYSRDAISAMFGVTRYRLAQVIPHLTAPPSTQPRTWSWEHSRFLPYTWVQRSDLGFQGYR